MIYRHPPDCTCAECDVLLVRPETSDRFCDVLEILIAEWGEDVWGWEGEQVERLVLWRAAQPWCDC